MEHKAEHPQKAKELTLPTMVASPGDVGRLSRELEMIDEALLQLGLRSGGHEVKMPKTSSLMDKIVEQNGLNLLHPEDRKALKFFLESVRDKAPVIHMSFSADPAADFIEKIMVWLRREIHPLTLLTVGLQPGIGAGCIVRTTNKYFDFSLKQNFSEKRDLLKQSLAKPEPEVQT